VAGRRRVEPDHVLQQRALAAARTAEDHEHLAAPDLARDVLEDHPIAVLRGESFDADDRFAGSRHS